MPTVPAMHVADVGTGVCNVGSCLSCNQNIPMSDLWAGWAFTRAAGAALKCASPRGEAGGSRSAGDWGSHGVDREGVEGAHSLQGQAPCSLHLEASQEARKHGAKAGTRGAGRVLLAPWERSAQPRQGSRGWAPS